MMHQSSGGWRVIGSGKRREKREWVTGPDSFAVVGFRAGVEAPNSCAKLYSQNQCFSSCVLIILEHDAIIMTLSVCVCCVLSAC